eukprot:scaffold275792_cov28-Tisochrysis_lutea.AAC.5
MHQRDVGPNVRGRGTHQECAGSEWLGRFQELSNSTKAPRSIELCQQRRRHDLTGSADVSPAILESLCASNDTQGYPSRPTRAPVPNSGCAHRHAPCNHHHQKAC